jgi:glycerophosphoryl diester phosphodiesterase
VDERAWAGLHRPIAHRGLWDRERPENSLAAFAAAAEAGYGIELDVQLSADGEVMVFHDDRLERMTDGHGRLCDYGLDRLKALRLAGTEERIPTLQETLATVAGRVLVVVEMKVLGGEEGPLEARVASILDAYDGPAAVLSFNPVSIAAFAEFSPTRLRGLNSMAYTDAAFWMLSPKERQGLSTLAQAAEARPHFLGLGLDMLPSFEGAALRAQGMPVACWTVRSPEQWERVRLFCDTPMFEGWRP